MFIWIICAKRPLHIDELQEGIAFSIDDYSWCSDNIPTDMIWLVKSSGVDVDATIKGVHSVIYGIA